MATAPSPNDLTRQQLDELDALLQKMLTVPLAPVETSPPVATFPPLAQPPVPPSWRVDPPAPAPSLAHLAPAEPPATLKFEPPAAQTPVQAPVNKAPKPTPAPVPPPVQVQAPAPKQPAPVASAPVQVPVPPAALKQVPPVAPAAPKVAPAPAPKPAAPTPVAPAADTVPVPLPAIPFVALNGLFDSICGVFGLPGRLLCSGFFKNLYGLTGLGLIVYTGLHVAQVQGWLTLPVQLPWPK